MKCSSVLKEKFYYLIDLHYSQTTALNSQQSSLFYYLIDLHYSQTVATMLLRISGVLLPYRFTLFSNGQPIQPKNVAVLLPYRFTLFSNTPCFITLSRTVLLPYRFTLFSNSRGHINRRMLVLLPYRFTLFSNICRIRKAFGRFYYLIDLHYSQTCR